MQKSQELILPRMKTQRDKEAIFSNKRKHIEATCIEEVKSVEKDKDKFTSYYLRTLDKIKRSRKVANPSFN